MGTRVGWWFARAACAGVGTDLFFQHEEHRGARAQESLSKARELCYACPVRTECLGYAIAEKIDHGVWGGHTAFERSRLRKRVSA